MQVDRRKGAAHVTELGGAVDRQQTRSDRAADTRSTRVGHEAPMRLCVEARQANHPLGTCQDLTTHLCQVGRVLASLSARAARVAAHGYSHRVSHALFDEAYQLGGACKLAAARGRWRRVGWAS
eukprot:CAMPEP_0174751442 /NCGR_PEP_ID=MMETSP1094-20130205/99850_1 /TAXON_ID=156173 /ORGANISM="Chrysochromulina brevifilum, Strain UTEX LB 985" /LENGTH=123 /DNA_ID=CAMNT_0015956937 /DNA_START=283 /DNA_END=651 /DNA_ORIENTATION=+